MKEIGWIIFNFRFEGTTYRFLVQSDKELEYSHLLPEKPKINETKILFAPMPGLVKSVNCTVGDQMIEGQELCVVGKNGENSNCDSSFIWLPERSNTF